MITDGEKFKSFVNKERLSKVDLAQKLGMSKQNLFQLFKTKQMEKTTKDKIEKVLKTSWSTIERAKVNIDQLEPIKIKDVQALSESDAMQVILRLVDGNNSLIESNKILAVANKDIAAANKDLAAANLKMATDHGDLVQLAKHAFGLNLSKQPSDDSATDLAKEEGLPPAARELNVTGRSGAFELAGRNAPKGSSKAKGK